MNLQDWLWVAALSALVVAAIAAIVDARRYRRAQLDRPGWVPWRGVQVVAWFGAAVLAMLAMGS